MNVEIYYGVIDINNDEPDPYHNFPLNNRNVIIHSEYNSVNFANDIALIRLEEKLKFTGKGN